MVEEDGSENLLQKLFMRQLSLSWAVLSNSQSLLFMGARALIIRLQDRQQLALEEVELSIDPVLKANTSEAEMAPYVTVRGAEPVPTPAPKPKETTMADVAVAPVVIAANAVFLTDADRVEKLLDIIQNTVEMPNVPCIRAAAANEIAQIEHDLWVQMYPEQAAQAELAEKERVKVEEERQKRIKEQQEKERQAKEKEEQPPSWVPPRDTQAHPNQERRV